MRYLLEQSGKGSRPYPLDRERRRRVMVALVQKGLTISALAKRLTVSKQYVSAVINGRRLSYKTEQCIADFLGKPVDYLFPYRTPAEIKKMREAEAALRKAKRGDAA